MKQKAKKTDRLFNKLLEKHDNHIRVKLVPDEKITLVFHTKKARARRKTKQQIERDRINNHIDKLMIEYGPDGHTDGSAIITAYIMSLLKKERRKNEK